MTEHTGTNGLGKETVLFLAAHSPNKIIFTGRQRAAADELISECRVKFPKVPVSFVHCDLASLDAVKTAAKTILAENQRLDILLAVAGIMLLPPALTADGYELHFGTNHMGHALLIKLLLPLLESTSSMSESSDVRIVLYTSLAAMMPSYKGIDFDAVRTPQGNMYFGGWRRYAQSKLANIFYARKLAEHHPNIITVSVHPGVAYTGLVSNLGLLDRTFIAITSSHLMRPVQEVAWNGCWAATAPVKGSGQAGEESKLPPVENGVYYEPVGIKGELRGFSGSDELAQKLWDWTETELSRWTM